MRRILKRAESNLDKVIKASPPGKEFTGYKCWITGKLVSIAELRAVDARMAKLDEEIAEEVHDVLKSKRPRKAPYTHKSDKGYPVVNICRASFNKALKHAREMD